MKIKISQLNKNDIFVCEGDDCQIVYYEGCDTKASRKYIVYDVTEDDIILISLSSRNDKRNSKLQISGTMNNPAANAYAAYRWPVLIPLSDDRLNIIVNKKSYTLHSPGRRRLDNAISQLRNRNIK